MAPAPAQVPGNTHQPEFLLNVSQACVRRKSVRAFSPEPISVAMVEEILELAHRGSPSGGNLQPWLVYALTGAPLAEFKAAIAGSPAEEPSYDVYPRNLREPYRTRRFEAGEDLYGVLGIKREDRPARLRQFARNAEFFGAPVGLFFCIDRHLGPPQWADLGMYMQTVMLLAVERGLDTCPQEYWSLYPRAVARALSLPSEIMVFSGMALGRRDEEHAINRLQTRRAALDEFAKFIGF